MNNDEIILHEYKEAFRKYAKDGVIDMDKRLKIKFSFQIHRLENFVGEMQGVMPPARQSQYFVSLIEKGNGQKSIGSFNFSIRENLLLCVPKRVMQSSQYWSLDCSGYMLSFNIDFFLQKGFPKKLIINKKIFKSSVKPYLILSQPQVKKIEVIFESILGECDRGCDERNEFIAVKILELLIECERFYDKACAESDGIIYHDILEAFNELLEKNYAKQRTVQFYADALHIHPNYLNALCQKHTGLSAKETINTHILNEAKYLLASSSLSVKEVAHKLGFEHSDYFYAFFRKGLNMSPGQYRGELV
jgi:AraC-like DNA-binding protein